MQFQTFDLRSDEHKKRQIHYSPLKLQMSLFEDLSKNWNLLDIFFTLYHAKY